ncbi:MAG TPA: hypothetical protein VI792_11090 [Candidatus Eisenbacteria bacterium]
MTRANVLLIESLDCPGTAGDDARLRAAALRAGGFMPRVLAVAPPGRAPAGPGGAVPEVAWREGPAAVRAALAAHSVDLAIVASASPGGGTIARWLPSRLPARWWPTALDASSPRLMLWPAGRALDPLDDGAGGCGVGRAGGAASRTALDWAIVDEGAVARRQLPLWDGDYVVVPAALGRDAGAEALAAFAALARDRQGLDLVVLGHPQERFERLARSLGVGVRVHFVGPATRGAEYAWLKPAAAALVASPGPIAAGLIMRALATGCPVVDAGARAGARVLGPWLEARGAAASSGEPLHQALDRVLDRGARVEQAIECGRRASLAHRAQSLGTRLAAALAPHADAAAPSRAA